ncbi:MAG: DUF4173 domain-containing protein [Bifidobacteriaceae bacterium]|jgi:hypothetical protein|nr:DUF4173 domain-containing protein [Bifidobacteriaceae bacterium]
MSKTEQEPSPQRGVLYALAALWLALVFDRVIIATLEDAQSEGPIMIAFSVFWLIVLATFGALFWRQLREVGSRASLFCAVIFVALCGWLIWEVTVLSPRYSNVGFTLTTMPLMCVLSMLVAQLGVERRSLYKPLSVVGLWFRGWFVLPFTRISRLGRVVTGNLPQSRSRWARIGVGVAAGAVLLCILVPLLASADPVFNGIVSQIFSGAVFAHFLPHFMVVVLISLLVFSLLWNFGTVTHASEKSETSEIDVTTDAISSSAADTTVAGVVLGILDGVYAAFCAIQFTYLFAGEGLPDGLTYSSYARQGFGQLIAVTAINLAVFGACVTHGEQARRGNDDPEGLRIPLWQRSRPVSILGMILIALTGVILASASTRLSLYVAAYGLTWLRLISLVFIGYLCVVLILCVVRVMTSRIPLVAVCVGLGLVVYVIVGFANPDWIIQSVNATFGY